MRINVLRSLSQLNCNMHVSTINRALRWTIKPSKTKTLYIIRDQSNEIYINELTVQRSAVNQNGTVTFDHPGCRAPPCSSRNNFCTTKRPEEPEGGEVPERRPKCQHILQRCSRNLPKQMPSIMYHGLHGHLQTSLW
jgi:hypothetical protein